MTKRKAKAWQIELLIAAGLISLGLFYSSQKPIAQTNQKTQKAAQETKDSKKTTKINSIEPTLASETKILFVGDTMLARSVGEKIQNGIDPFELIKPVFVDYQAIIANLETTVSDKGTAVIGKAYKFRAPVQSIDFLKNANITAVSLANNHTKDYGDEALIDTMDRLKTGGIDYFGAGINQEEAFSGKVIDVSGVKIGLIAFNEIENKWTMSKTGPTSAWTDLPKLKEKITALKEISDVVIVMPHFGVEYTTSQNSWQTKLSKILIDNGADLIIGNHPHVVQPNEIYKDKKIYYSLGNFVFDKMEGLKNATDGEMIEVVLKDKKILSTKELKVKLGKDGRPAIVQQ